MCDAEVSAVNYGNHSKLYLHKTLFILVPEPETRNLPLLITRHLSAQWSDTCIMQ